jgi:hypothetical protein
MLGYRHQALEVEDRREEVKSFECNEKMKKAIDHTGMHLPLMLTFLLLA